MSKQKSPKSLLQRGLRLEYFTLFWNVVGIFITAFAAFKAHSVAIGGFGLDSLIEIGASTVVIWEYLLTRGSHPGASMLGIAWTAITFVTMLLLANAKRITGNQLNNPVLITEGKVTLIDAYLAGSVLIGLVLNATLQWWWADLASALVIVYYGFKEGRAALREAKHH